MQTKRIIGVKYLGKQKTLDFEVEDKNHNFIADGVVVSNSHACAYSYLSALTLYLKYKYPQNFYCECLKMAVNKSDSQDHTSRIQQELSYFGIELLPPDLIKSKNDFSLEGKDIRYGFSSIKGVSEKALTALTSFLSSEKTNKFEVFNAAENSKLNVGIVCCLIQAGMLSSLSSDRERLVFEAQVWGKLTDKEKVFCMERGHEYDFDLLHMVKNIHSWTNDAGKKIAAKTRLETIRKNCVKQKEIYHMNKKHSLFASWSYERRILGYAYSTTLKNVFKEGRPSIKNIDEVKNLIKDSNVEGVFEVFEVRRGVSGRGNKYMKLSLQDETGTFDAMILGDKYEVYAKKHPDPVKGDIIYLIGSKGDELIWMNGLLIQNSKVFLKLADLK